MESLSFDNYLLRRRAVKAEDVKAARRLAAEKGVSFFKALLHGTTLDSSRLWKLMEEHVIERLRLLFDRKAMKCVYEPGRSGPESSVLLALSVPDVIVAGVRGMTNSSLIRSHLPGPDEEVHIQIPGYFSDLPLSAPEKYILSLIGGSPDLRGLYASSELGEEETSRNLFLLLCLGLVDVSPSWPADRPSPDISFLEFRKLLERLNAKLAAVFRYVSKEIGPVALTALEKGLEETRGNLSPALAEARLAADGRLDSRTIPGNPAKLAGQTESRDLLRDLNEILAAEILVVKKILGDEHESALVRALRDI